MREPPLPFTIAHGALAQCTARRQAQLICNVIHESARHGAGYDSDGNEVDLNDSASANSPDQMQLQMAPFDRDSRGSQQHPLQKYAAARVEGTAPPRPSLVSW